MLEAIQFVLENQGMDASLKKECTQVLNEYNVLSTDHPSTYPALKYVILPFAALYLTWVAVASFKDGGKGSDMGLDYLTKSWY